MTLAVKQTLQLVSENIVGKKKIKKNYGIEQYNNVDSNYILKFFHYITARPSTFRNASALIVLHYNNLTSRVTS